MPTSYFSLSTIYQKEKEKKIGEESRSRNRKEELSTTLRNVTRGEAGGSLPNYQSYFCRWRSRFAFKRARRVPRDRAEAAGAMGTSFGRRLSSPRSQKQDQFTKYRLYCGFIIPFTVSSFVPRLTFVRERAPRLLIRAADGHGETENPATTCLLIHFY